MVTAAQRSPSRAQEQAGRQAEAWAVAEANWGL